MKILITCVCYNNYQDAIKYINSLSNSLDKASMVQVDIYIVNNGIAFTEEEQNSFISSNLLKVYIVENQTNNGYFPGCLKGLNHSLMKGNEYDAMFVSNVDLKVSDNFFAEFSRVILNYSSSPAIIAPSIYSIYEDKDRNPKVLTRFTVKQMKKYLFLYAIPYLNYFYKKTFYKNKKNKVSIVDSSSTIYAPHGSFIIFIGGRKFWSRFLEYPIFLFGEEIYVGEEARKKDIPIYYCPTLKVIDSDHASTGKENELFIRKHNFKAISYLFERYWKASGK